MTSSTTPGHCVPTSRQLLILAALLLGSAGLVPGLVAGEKPEPAKPAAPKGEPTPKPTKTEPATKHPAKTEPKTEPAKTEPKTEPAKPPVPRTPEAEARELQSLYRRERAELDRPRFAGVFNGEAIRHADVVAARADQALAAGRLVDARVGYHDARWALPMAPADFPGHVARVFGSLKFRHAAAVNCVRWTPDGTAIVSGCGDLRGDDGGAVTVWDAATGRALRTFPGVDKPVLAVAVSPDGRLVAAAGVERDVKVWELATGKEVWALRGHTDVVRGLAFSHTGKLLASGGYDHAVKLWAVDTGKEVRTLSAGAGGGTQVFSVCFAPDDAIVAASDQSGQVRLWSVATGKTLLGLVTHVDQSAYAVAISPDGKTFASGGADTFAKLCFMPGLGDTPDPAAGTVVQTFKGSGGAVRAVAFSPDGKTLATAGSDNSVRLWDVRTGQNYSTFHGHAREVSSLAFSPSGDALVSAGKEQFLLVWPLGGDERHRRLDGHGSVWSAAFTPDSKRIVSAGADRAVRVWDAQTGKSVLTWQAHALPVTAAVPSPDGARVLTAGGDRVLVLWDLKTGAKLRTFDGGHKHTVTAAAFSPDGKTIVSGGVDHRVLVWDVDTGKVLRTLDGPTAVVSAVAFSPDGKTIVAGGGDRTVRLWDAATGQELAVVAVPAAVGGVAVSPDSRTLAVCGSDRVVQLWPLTPTPGGAAVPGAADAPRPLDGHTGPVSSVGFSPDGRYLVSGGSDQVVKVWDVATGVEVRGLRGHTDWVAAVGFSPDGRSIVSAGVDGTVRVWEHVPRESSTAAGHTAKIRTVAVSPDGKQIASAGDDFEIKLWDVTDNRSPRSLPGHQDMVTALAYTPDGGRLVSAAGNTVKVWDVKTGRELKSFKANAGGGEDRLAGVPALTLTADGKRAVVWVTWFGPPPAPTASNVEVYDLASGEGATVIRDQNRPCLAFGTDGLVTAMGSGDGTIRLWKTLTGEKIGDDIAAFKESLGDLIFTPDNKKLLAGGVNGEVKVFDVTTHKVVTSFQAHDKRIVALGVNTGGTQMATVSIAGEVKCWDLVTGKPVRTWNPVSARNLAWTPDGKYLATANENTTVYLLEVK